MTVTSDRSEHVLMTAHDLVTEWCAQLGIEPSGELVQAAVASVEALIRRKGTICREEAYRAAHAAMLNWVETTISGPPPYLDEEVHW